MVLEVGPWQAFYPLSHLLCYFILLMLRQESHCMAQTGLSLLSAGVTGVSYQLNLKPHAQLPALPWESHCSLLEWWPASPGTCCVRGRCGPTNGRAAGTECLQPSILKKVTLPQPHPDPDRHCTQNPPRASDMADSQRRRALVFT